MAIEARITIDPAACDAVIFDMDGVLTTTARVHARAWKAMFDEYLEARARAGEGEQRPFDLEEDYERHVDGRPRYDGVRSFLASRGIELEEGSPDDPPGRETVCGLGNRKNERFLESLREDGAQRFVDAVELVRELREAGVRTAVISASRNAGEVLAEAGIADLFQTRVDGVVAAEERLEGKPAPDVFLEAARQLGASPARCAVVEDALAGVQAARRGGFAWVIGVARRGGAEDLAAAGADAVVHDLSEVAVAGAPGRDRPIAELPDALENVTGLAQTIGDREVVLFLDFDGTLAPIVEVPEDAALPPETVELLADLASRRLVAVVSGRDLGDLRQRVGLEDVYCAGSHGFRLAGPGGLRREHAGARGYLPALDEAEARLRSELAGIEGVQVERKRYAVAVHHRRAPESVLGDVRRAVESVQGASAGALRVDEGRRIFELRPDLDWDKGKAVGWLLSALDLEPPHAVPIYIGDDTTDEDAFRAVEDAGLAIVVHGRTGRTRARYALEDPAAVRAFLARLDAELPP